MPRHMLDQSLHSSTTEKKVSQQKVLSFTIFPSSKRSTASPCSTLLCIKLHICTSFIFRWINHCSIKIACMYPFPSLEERLGCRPEQLLIISYRFQQMYQRVVNYLWNILKMVSPLKVHLHEMFWFKVVWPNEPIWVLVSLKERVWFWFRICRVIWLFRLSI